MSRLAIVILQRVSMRAIGTSMMNPKLAWRPDGQLLCLQELINANVAGDILEVASGIWAIHGDIPVDRDVILAEFSSYQQATIALDQLLRWMARNTDH